MRHGGLRVGLTVGTSLALTLLGARVVLATTILINNVDAAGEGFNDGTPTAPVGGNAGITLGLQRLNAFEYAAGIWESVLDSAVTIRVDAKFDPQQCSMGGALLGSAGAAGAFADFPGAPAAATLYPSAIADKLAGFDQDAGASDINATFNSNVGSGGGCPFTFYLGFDGNTASSTDIDLVSVVLHELAHGLGFNTLLLPDGGQPYSLGYDDNYAHWLEDHTLGLTMPSMTQAQRQSAQRNTGNLHFIGPLVRTASSVLVTGAVGDHVQMYAPNPYQSGSSVAHWDTVLVPDQLQEPAYTGPNHDPGLALPLLCDVGWAPCKCGDGVVDAGEGCDDNGTTAGDGCDAICQVEECWTCAGEPSVCGFAGSGTSCTDHDACTQTDQCDGAGTCVGSNPVTCTPLDDCHDAGVCAPATGLCSDPPAIDGTPCDDGDTCTGPDSCANGVCLGPPQCIDPFLCYKAKSADSFSPPPTQTLLDEFNELADFSIVKPKYLCTPAEKDGAPQIDPGTHLEGYSIKLASGPSHTKRTHIMVRSQLDSAADIIIVDTVKPDFLLVPTAKSLASDPPPPSVSIDVDHYKCYKAKVSKGTPKFPKGVTVSLADQFIATAQTFAVSKVSHLCTPVDKEGEGIKHPAIHQLCYKVKAPVKNPKHLGLFTHNQFGAGRLDTVKEGLLCLPSLAGADLPSGPALIHDYELNGAFADSFGGPDMVSNGGTLGPTGYTFAAGQGPNLSGAMPVSSYSILMGFTIDVTTGYKKLIDFKDRTVDAGVYNLSTALNFYPSAAGPAGAFTAGVPVTVLVTRDGSTGGVAAYVNGVLQLSFTDSTNLGTFTGPGQIVHFLRDDAASMGEQSSGFLDFVRIYDGPITP